MPAWSRRRALQALATGTALALAGCRERNLFAEQTPDVRRRRPVEDYEVRKVRDTDARPVFWTEESGRPTPSEEERRDGLYVDAYLAESDDLASVTFASREAGTRLREFAAATDFAERSVALQSLGIRACRALRLSRVVREPDGYDLSFCQPFRSPDTACDAAAYDTVAVAIRLPFPGTGISSRGASFDDECRNRPLPILPETPTEGDDG